MAYEYKVLSQEERDEITVQFLAAQERDLFCHQLNLERYQAMLPTLEDGEFKEKLAKEIPVVESRIKEVASIIAATEAQLPVDIKAAVDRLDAKAIAVAVKG